MKTKAGRSSALVSVCITSYNYGRYVRDAIESALTQTYPNIEVVVSDNASTDSTHAVLAEYADDPRVNVFINDENVGLCKNHNLAISRSRGEYVVVLSADDILFPEHVDRLLRRMEDPLDPVLITFGQGVLLNDDLKMMRPIHSCGNLPIPFSRRDDFGNILFNYHHMYPARLIARSVYDEFGLFDERVSSGIDLEICARFEAADVPSAFVPAFVAGFREHDKRTSAQLMADTNELFSDKLYMYEHGLKPENAWRVEGYESLILTVADLELHRLHELGAEPLDAEQGERMNTLRTRFAEMQQIVPRWPETEPQLSVVVLTEGYLALLQLTLDSIIAQQVDRTEIVIVQTSGCDVASIVSILPYGKQIRVVQAGIATSPVHAYRYGLALARGEYIAYLDEGQIMSEGVYANIIQHARMEDAQLALVPKQCIDEGYTLGSYLDFHVQQFGTPTTRAQARLEAGEYSLCQMLHRRAMLRAGSIHFDTMTDHTESELVTKFAGLYRTVILGFS